MTREWMEDFHGLKPEYPMAFRISDGLDFLGCDEMKREDLIKLAEAVQSAYLALDSIAAPQWGDVVEDRITGLSKEQLIDIVTEDTHKARSAVEKIRVIHESFEAIVRASERTLPPKHGGANE